MSNGNNQDLLLIAYGTTNATCHPLSDNYLGTVYHLHVTPNPFVDPFPTPLQLRPPAGMKICLIAQTQSSNATINASGFLGQ